MGGDANDYELSDEDQLEDSDINMGPPPNQLCLSAQAPRSRFAPTSKTKSSFTKSLRAAPGKAIRHVQVKAAKVVKVACNTGRKEGSLNF